MSPEFIPMTIVDPPSPASSDAEHPEMPTTAPQTNAIATARRLMRRAVTTVSLLRLGFTLTCETFNITMEEESHCCQLRAPSQERIINDADITIADVRISESVRVRIYHPRTPGRSGFVWAHGGAFVAGTLDDAEADQPCRFLAEQGITTVSVDYRLAPLHDEWAAEAGMEPHGGVHFPVAMNDVVDAYRWARRALVDRAETWSLGGASAGAALAASATLRLRDEGDPPASLVLAYPIVHPSLPPASEELQAKTSDLEPRRRFPPQEVERMTSNYLGGAPRNAAYAFAGASELRDLPPVLIINSELDDLRASGEQFAADLRTSRVIVRMETEEQAFHGHLSVMGDHVARKTMHRIEGWLRHI